LSNVNLVLKQQAGGLGVSGELMNATRASFRALDVETQRLLTSFVGMNLADPGVPFKKLQVKLIELLNKGIKPAIENLKQIYAETSKELILAQSMEKASAATQKLANDIANLTLVYKSGAASMEQMTQLYTLLDQKKKSTLDISNQEIVLMQKLAQHIIIASQSIQGYGEIQKRLITEIAPLEAMGKTYEANNARLAILTQTMDAHIRTLSVMKSALTGAITVENQYDKATQQVIIDSERMQVTLQQVGNVLSKFRAISSGQTMLGGKPLDVSQTKKEAEELLSVFQQLRLIGQGVKVTDFGVTEWTELLEMAAQKLGVDVDKILAHLNRLKSQQAIKFAPEIESGKISSEVDQLKQRLLELSEVERKGGASVDILNEKYKIRMRLMELTGTKT
jgi:hypothetical protein